MCNVHTDRPFSYSQYWTGPITACNGCSLQRTVIKLKKRLMSFACEVKASGSPLLNSMKNGLLYMYAIMLKSIMGSVSTCTLLFDLRVQFTALQLKKKENNESMHSCYLHLSC